jgi:hypothetical protein
MDLDGSGLDRFATPGQHLASGVVHRKGGTILDDDTAKLGQSPAFGEAQHLQGHLPNEAFSHGAQESGKTGLEQLILKGFVGASDVQ